MLDLISKNSAMDKVISFLKLMRIKHYVKNFLIFLPLIFSKRLLELPLLINSLCGFVSFSLLSSVIYIINDIKDIDKDRVHPTKCNRPIASGKIKSRSAIIFSIVLLFLSLTVNFIANGTNIIAWILLLSYFILNFGYSFGLKKIPILDVAILASGFLLRLFYGSVVCDITLSSWLYLTTALASFYLGFGKRRNEYKIEADETRLVLKSYTYEFLDRSMVMCITLAMVFYSLWTIDVAQGLNSSLVWTVPFLLLIVLKYSFNIEKGVDGDPTEVILKDPILLIMILIYVAVMFFILYT